jgi:hypothetical protein
LPGWRRAGARALTALPRSWRSDDQLSSSVRPRVRRTPVLADAPGRTMRSDPRVKPSPSWREQQECPGRQRDKDVQLRYRDASEQPAVEVLPDGQSQAHGPACCSTFLSIGSAPSAAYGRGDSIRHAWMAEGPGSLRLDGSPVRHSRVLPVPGSHLGVRRGHRLGPRTADPARCPGDRLHNDGGHLHALDGAARSFCEPDGRPSFELASAYLCIALLLLAMGPGKFSLDAKLFGERL